jgi:RsiW-degrading membrane proteinase PrsW (M82 family)
MKDVLLVLFISFIFGFFGFAIGVHSWSIDQNFSALFSASLPVIMYLFYTQNRQHNELIIIRKLLEDSSKKDERIDD